MMRLGSLVCLFLISVSIDISVASDVNDLSGKWEPGSHAYQNYPGTFVIAGTRIRFPRCGEMAFVVLKHETREDNLWDGSVRGNVQRYR